MGVSSYVRRKGGALVHALSGQRHSKSGIVPLVLAALAVVSPQAAQARLQCVPFARAQSGIAIFGNASTWWNQAEGVYARGRMPREGAVLAMASSRAMPVGHVAVVHKIVDARHILIDHANWSAPGLVERGVMAEDVSAAGDWSEVRVFHRASGGLGIRVNPVRGFIYPEAPVRPRFDIAQHDTTEPASVFEAFDRAMATARQPG